LSAELSTTTRRQSTQLNARDAADAVQDALTLSALFQRRCLCRLAGALSPHGGMPRDMRLTFRKHRPALKSALETMIAWNPERVIIAHGRWFDNDGVRALKRSFAWLLD